MYFAFATFMEGNGREGSKVTSVPFGTRARFTFTMSPWDMFKFWQINGGKEQVSSIAMNSRTPHVNFRPRGLTSNFYQSFPMWKFNYNYYY